LDGFRREPLLDSGDALVIGLVVAQVAISVPGLIGVFGRPESRLLGRVMLLAESNVKSNVTILYEQTSSAPIRAEVVRNRSAFKGYSSSAYCESIFECSTGDTTRSTGVMVGSWYDVVSCSAAPVRKQ